jgi:Zn-dependent protease with chaperone function
MAGLQPTFLAHATHSNLGEAVVDGRITINQWHFQFRSENYDVQIPLARLEIVFGDADSGGIFFSDPEQPEWTVYTCDNRILQDVHLATNANTRVQIKSFGNRKELNRRLKITIWVLGGFAGLAVGITVFCSLAVRLLVSKIPPKFEQDLGASFFAEIQQDETFVTNSAMQARLDQAAAPLLAVIPTNRLNLQLFIIEEPEPNAFSMPGGYVVFTTGLLELLNTPEQVAGVMAHEIAHVTEKHMFRQVISSFGPVLLIELLCESGSGRASTVGAASSLLIVKGFSQEYEFEADEVGWKSLLAAKVNPRGMIEMLSKLKEYEDKQKDLDVLPGAFSSHPATAKRIRKLESKWKSVKGKAKFVELNAQVNTDSGK